VEFVFLMLCRCLILFLSFFDNQILDVDREGLTKLKKAVKAMHASGNGKKRNFLENILHNNFFLDGTLVEGGFIPTKRTGSPF
jgi:hypothetical protein